MGVEFDWQMEEEGEPDDNDPRGPRPWWIWWVLLAVLVGVGGGVGYVWRLGQTEIDEETAQRTAQVSERFAELVDMYELPDLQPFYDEAGLDQTWQARQLHPENVAFWQGNPQVTHIERNGLEIWANVMWTTDRGETRQRIVYFEERGDDVRLRDQSRRFWGNPRRHTAAWGSIRYYNIDEVYIAPLDSVLDDVLAEQCVTLACADLTVLLTDTWQETAATDTLRLPSPRLWGLDENGQPTASYWAYVRQQTAVLVGETMIRFAVPRAELSRYQTVLQQYMAANPRRQVELVPYDQLPTDPAEFLSLVDGAMMVPRLELVQNGRMRDITDFANTDPAFATHDFYEQIWSAPWWQERMWGMPHTAELPLVYYDVAAYREAGLDRPQLDWTWEDLQQQATILTKDAGFEWGMATYNQDLLYSYVYNQSNACEEEVAILCNPVVQTGDVAATLDFYDTFFSYAPDLRGLSDFERVVVFQNQVSPSTATTALWVDIPAEYERHFLSRGSQVTIFPGSEQFPGVTPLQVSSAVMSSETNQARAVWDWFSFLSYQYPNKVARQIPARPSVARTVLYWESLPRELHQPMVLAFPNARPILLEEQELFADSVLAEWLGE